MAGAHDEDQGEDAGGSGLPAGAMPLSALPPELLAKLPPGLQARMAAGPPAERGEGGDEDEDDLEETPQVKGIPFLEMIQAQNETKREWRRLPRMVRLAASLVWRASPSRALFTTITQLVSALGIGVQLLAGNGLLTHALQLRASGGDVTDLVPAAIRFALLSIALAVLTSLSSVQSGILGDLVGASTYDHLLDASTSVALSLFEGSEFYDALEKARFGAMMQPSSIVNGLVSVLAALVGGLSIAAALISLQPLLVLVVLIGAVPAWIATSRNAHTRIRVFGEQTPEDRERGYLRTLLTDRIAAKEIRAFGLVAPIRARHDVLTDGIIARSKKAAYETARRTLLAEGATGLTTAAGGLLVLGLLVNGRLAIAAAVTVTVAMQQLRSRAAGAATSMGGVFQSSLFLESFDQFLQLPKERAAHPVSHEPIAPFRRLAAEHVGFTYPGAPKPSLIDIDVEIKAGEIVALVGENGSGKTTLAKVLSGLFPATDGQVLWDDADLADLDPAAVRDNLTVIFQDFVRYSLTLRENITFGRHEDADDEARMLAAADVADVTRIADRLPAGFDTRLGREFGKSLDLSGGQWQRVALARAFFRDAPFLVLDEPTAALDARAEFELFRRIRQLAAGRSVLLITHRFGNVRTADRIYVLHRGKVVESGSHDDLMAQGGRYAELFTMQASAHL